MMIIADGHRYSQVQRTKVGQKLQVEIIRASKICMLTKAVISIIRIQLLTRVIMQMEVPRRNLINLQKKKKRTCSFTHKARVERHLIEQKMNHHF